MIFVEQVIKCLYLKAEESDELRADKDGETSTEGGGVGVEVGGGGGGGGCSSNGAGVGRYRYYNDKNVIPSTLDDLEEDQTETHLGELGGGGGGGCSGANGGGGGGGGDCCGGGGGGVIGDGSGLTLVKDSCVGFSSSPGAGGGTVGFSSSPDEHDSDSVVSDTLIKEEHSAFMDPLHTDFHFPQPPRSRGGGGGGMVDLDFPPQQHQHHHHHHRHHRDLDYEVEHVSVTLRCSHSLRQSHSLPELGVTKVVKQLSHADLTRRAHFRSIIYILALSLHGIFEGLALGLQSRESSVWSLCFALCLHRCVLAFQLGMDLCGARESQGTAFLCIGTFTLISALGIVAGILFSSGALLYADVTVPEAILQSLATGTILYIVFFDILFKDLQGIGDLKRVSSCFVGFSLMAIILAITTR